jgi:hypothetical protein
VTYDNHPCRIKVTVSASPFQEKLTGKFGEPANSLSADPYSVVSTMTIGG